MDLKTGIRLQGGKYRIERTLGRGSFGITYLAVTRFTTTGTLGQMEVEAKVALKEFFMSDINSRGRDGSSVEGSGGSICADYRRKFRREAENLAKLTHPNIIRVFDVFDENGTSYYAMEFIDGGSLDEYIAHCGRLSESDAVGLVRGVGRALEYMHTHRMLHLDVKPKNVMRRGDGHPYLIDFGLSKQYDANGEPESSTTLGLGTPGYAPLEQAHYRQDGTFPATLDVYALGATLFKILTGQRPPEATSVLNDGFPKDALSSCRVSGQTVVALEKAMAPIRKQRYATVGEFLGALPEIEEDPDSKEDDGMDESIKIIDSDGGGTSKSDDKKPEAAPFAMWRDRNWFTNIFTLLCLVHIVVLFPAVGVDLLKDELSVKAYLVVIAYLLLCLHGTLRILRNRKKGWYLPFLFVPVAEFLCNFFNDDFLSISSFACINYGLMSLTLLIRKNGVSAFKKLGQTAPGDDAMENFSIWKSRNWFTNVFSILLWLIVIYGVFGSIIYYFSHCGHRYGAILGTLIGIGYSHYLLFKNYRMGHVITPLCILAGALFEFRPDNYPIYLFMALGYILEFLTFLIRKHGHSALSLMK